jgi:hypothetical protein
MLMGTVHTLQNKTWANIPPQLLSKFAFQNRRSVDVDVLKTSPAAGIRLDVSCLKCLRPPGILCKVQTFTKKLFLKLERTQCEVQSESIHALAKNSKIMYALRKLYC